MDAERSDAPEGADLRDLDLVGEPEIGGEDHALALILHRCGPAVADMVVPISVLEHALTVIEQLERRQAELAERVDGLLSMDRGAAGGDLDAGTADDSGPGERPPAARHEGFTGWIGSGATSQR
jgi:hypothetical protein